MLLTTNDFTKPQSKIHFDRMHDIVKTTYVRRIAAIKTLQTEIQILLDRVADYKESENAYLKKWKVLQDLMIDEGRLVDGKISKSYLSTHPNFSREERDKAVLDLENIDALKEEGLSDELARTFNVPAVTLACQLECSKIEPIIKKVMYWEHKIKYAKLSIEMKKVEVEKLQSEIKAMEDGV
jgi:hypothetical protein